MRPTFNGYVPPWAWRLAGRRAHEIEKRCKRIRKAALTFRRNLAKQRQKGD